VGQKPGGALGKRRQKKDASLLWRASLDGQGHYIPRESEEVFGGVWEITLSFAQVGERLYPVRLELGPGVFQDDVPTGGITARLLHRIQLGALTDGFRREQTQDWTLQELIFGKAPPTYQLPPEGNRSGPKGWGEEFYQDVSVAYLKALGMDPHRPIQVMLPRYPGYTKVNVRDWVFRAREKGYLTSPRQGRAGGEATEKLLDALKARSKDRPGPRSRRRPTNS
jgi:hypothetical protein